MGYNNDDRLIVKRIFVKEEAGEIYKLQSNKKEFLDHYPRHFEWLNKTIDKVIKGERVAFGAFLSTYDNMCPCSKLIGSIILKFGEYAINAAEIKNIFIEEKYRSSTFGATLCNVAEDYCARKGYSKIMTEVPGNKYPTIKFFMIKDYKIDSIKESPFKNNEQLCVLHKDITPLYGGDFFDLFELSKWLLETVYAFKNIKGDPEKGVITFNLEINLKKGLKTKGFSKNDLEPEGLAIVFYTDNVNYEDIKKKIYQDENKHNLIFVFGKKFQNETADRCTNEGMLVFDYSSISLRFKDLFAYIPPKFEKEEIGGIIMPVNPKYYEEMKKKKKEFTFFKNGPVGKYLKKGDKIFLLLEPSQRYSGWGIKGYGTITDIYYEKPGDTWDKLKTRNPIFTKEEYNIYVKDKGKILGIVINDFQEIKTLSIEELNKIFGTNVSIFSTNIDPTTIQNHLLGTYVSDTTINKFNYAIKDTDNQGKITLKNKFEYDVVFSFAGEDRDLVRKVAEKLDDEQISYFYDENEKEKLWGKRLSDQFKTIYGANTRFVVLFISKHYPNKDWTDFELTIARREAENRNKEFILPIYLDDTILFGLKNDVSYLDINKEDADSIARAIVSKVRSYET